MAPPVAQLRPLQFRQAIDAFRRRAGNPQQTAGWSGVWENEHSSQFTVAQSVGYDIVGDISDAFDAALKNGTTLSDFSKQLVPILQAKGWWGTVENENGRRVQLGSQRRLATIFNTNMRTSYAAGRWQQIQETKADLPYLQYVCVDDQKTRPAHALWGGIRGGRPVILHVDDPWWDQHYPPCGWNCRCTVIQLSAAEARRRGITTKPPSGPPRGWFNPTTGKTIQVPYGIDPGWGYNVGKAAMQANQVEQAAKQLADKMVALPAQIAADALENEVTMAMGRELAAWAGRIATPVGDSRVVGTMSSPVVEAAQPAGSGAIVLPDEAAIALPATVLNGLPQRLAGTDAVLSNADRSRFLWMVTDADGEKAAIEVAAAADKGGNLVTGWQPAATVNPDVFKTLWSAP